MSASKNLAAILPSAGTELVLTERPIPTPGPDELIVRNRAIAINPVDWKIQSYGFAVQQYPHVLGSDIAGEVMSVGSKVALFKSGDRVTAYAGSIYSGKMDDGAFQTYSVVRQLATTAIPYSMPYTEASVFPMAVATVGAAFFADLELPRKSVAEEGKPGPLLLIWGASSSVGAIAVQFGAALGYTVYAVAGSKHHDWLSKIGATKVFDRSSKTAEEIVAAAAADGLIVNRVFDSVSTNESLSMLTDMFALIKAITSGEKSIISTVSPWPSDIPKPSGDVEIIATLSARCSTDLGEMGAWLCNEWLRDRLADGKVVPAPRVRIVDGGLAGIQKAMDISKEGVSGEKLVVVVD